jgi:hypothetical protein
MNETTHTVESYDCEIVASYGEVHDNSYDSMQRGSILSYDLDSSLLSSSRKLLCTYACIGLALLLLLIAKSLLLRSTAQFNLYR